MSHLDWWEWAMAAVTASFVVAMVMALYLTDDPDEDERKRELRDALRGPGEDDSTVTGGVWQIGDGE